MKWHCERNEGGWLIVCDTGQQYAALIKSSDFENHYDKSYLFWSNVLNVKYAALGLRKSLSTMLDFSADLEAMREVING